MLPVLFLAALLLPAGAALAQPRGFTCIGAEQLEEDVFAIPFAKGAAAPGEAARTNLAAAAERAKREPGRMLCVLGHAGPQEGGAQSGIQLAAKRAGEVAAALAKLGIERDRIRAEARRAAFARGAVPEERSVTVVLLPPGVGAEPAAQLPARAPEKPAGAPTEKPTAAPAERPAAAPTEKPAAAPAARLAPVPVPVPVPAEKPTAAPAERPAAAPVEKPAATPAERPAPVPAEKPAAAPAAEPARP